MMSVREIERFLEQWQMGIKDLHLRTILAPMPKGAGTVAGPLAAGTGLDSLGDGGGSGTGPSHHWPLGCRLWGRRSQSLDFRAVRGFLP